jgi:Cu2+-exporting ATPase
MILVLISVGKLLESISKGKTTDALKSLIKLSPQTATILQNEKEVLVAVENVKIDDIFVVKPGELVPVDGIVIEGSSTIDESALTGESLPVEKEIGCNVSSGTLNQSGFLKCKAIKVGKDTTINKIIQLVSDASSSKAPIAKIADKVSGIFVPSVIVIAIITFVIWILVGQTVDFALARGISVLVISCPCALGLATPVAIMVGNGKGAKNGILFKTAQSLETAGKINTVVFDKTGTITNGTPVVTDFVLSSNLTENQLLQIALNLEIKSEHPFAKAIVKKAEEKNLVAQNIENFMSFGGKGISGTFENFEYVAGKWDFVSTKIVKKINPEVSEIHNKCEKLAAKGKTPLYFVKDGDLLGAILVADTIKDDSKKAISVLKQMNINVVMLTGDNPITAKEIASQVGIEKVVANILPEEKANQVSKLSENSKVAMVGDGINDAPALATAYCGIAVGAGTDVAIDAADIVLMKNTLLDVPAAITLSKKTLRNIKQNLFWAFIYNIICIPLAAGCLFLPFGIILNPMIGAAAMSLSSFCVVTNSLRLNFAKIY